MLLLLLLLLFIAPVRLTLLWDGRMTVDLRIWGVGGSFIPDLTPDTPAQSRQMLRGIGTFLRTDKARHMLRRHIHLISLQALVCLSLSDAARTAFFTGLLQQITRFLPRKADIRIQPEFLGSTHLQARCILFFHLGTIIITAAMMLAAYLLEAREHPKPQPKEAYSHGTSHW